MAGLARICKAYGAMKVTQDGKTITYVWDYVADQAVEESEMPVGSERWKASEQRKWLGAGDHDVSE